MARSELLMWHDGQSMSSLSICSTYSLIPGMQLKQTVRGQKLQSTLPPLWHMKQYCRKNVTLSLRRIYSGTPTSSCLSSVCPVSSRGAADALGECCDLDVRATAVGLLDERSSAAPEPLAGLRFEGRLRSRPISTPSCGDLVRTSSAVKTVSAVNAALY